MSRRKGEPTPTLIRRAYPYAVRFPEEHARDLLRGAQYYLSAADRAMTVLVDQKWYILICFADRADALAFQRHAGGELV